MYRLCLEGYSRSGLEDLWWEELKGWEAEGQGAEKVFLFMACPFDV